MQLNKTLSVWMLILLFALMQIGVFKHEISHIQTQVDTTLLASSHQNSSHPDKDLPHEYCEQCLAHAHADVAISGDAFYIVLERNSYFISTAYIAYLFIVIPSAYLARAPPFLN